MQLDDTVASRICEIAKQCLATKNRQAAVSERVDGGRFLTYRSGEALPRSGGSAAIVMEIRAFINPFKEPENEMSVDVDAPVDEATGEPIPTERWFRHPPLICFYMHNWDIYRAAFGCHPEVVASILAEMEAEMMDKAADDNDGE